MSIIARRKPLVFGRSGATFATSRLPFSRVLGVLVRILAIRIEYDLPDAQRRWLPAQFEDGLSRIFVILDLPVRVIPNSAVFWPRRSVGVIETATPSTC